MVEKFILILLASVSEIEDKVVENDDITNWTTKALIIKQLGRNYEKEMSIF